MSKSVNPTLPAVSLPSRGAWIEIMLYSTLPGPLRVAPLAGSVDRNDELTALRQGNRVAPLAGSVDRNQKPKLTPPIRAVAPLAGSVDRNVVDPDELFQDYRRSPRGERG